MSKMPKCRVSLLTIVVAAACASAPASSPRATDVVSAISSTAAYVTNSQAFTLARGNDLSETDWAALANLHRSCRPTEAGVLPTGCFRVDSIRFFEDSAYVVGVLGPVPGREPGMLQGCGTEYRLWIKRDRAGWRVLDVATSLC